jgi:hypothetical protein
MPQPTPSIKLMLPITDYRVYVSAARLLIPVMGPKAPDALTLIRHTLGGRDATGIADDYLDSISWPLANGRVLVGRRGVPNPLRTAPTVATTPRTGLSRQSPSLGPGRN